MPLIDYSREPKSDIAFVDMKSFYASVECRERGLDPLKTSLCVMSRSEHSQGLILASSPTFKRIFGKTNVSRARGLPFDIQTRRFNYALSEKEGWQITPTFIAYIEAWAKHTYIVPPRMDLYIEKNLDIQNIFQEFASPKDILPYSIDESFLDLTSSLNYFCPSSVLSRKDKLEALARHIQHRIWKKQALYQLQDSATPILYWLS
ncbi:ImpB/MucB/SamB family protein [Streptococcus ictaluri 707-05]|uniref:ImpB/MucB/SamB family protein n=1 Tax=Streptococcus ictaluri 707-05 TaxID=764299 RepID=G5K3A5_9STRE|nr:ImpB/MucB/SamB family protein [Streptococcus ictaluri 707-05]